jgi:hypothetical protein
MGPPPIRPRNWPPTDKASEWAPRYIPINIRPTPATQPGEQMARSLVRMLGLTSHTNRQAHGP